MSRPEQPRRFADHPIGLLRRLYFRVTVNTDNRLMSDTTMSREFALLAEAFGYGWADLQWFTVNAMKSAFIPFDQRLTSDQRGHQASLRRADERLTVGPSGEPAGSPRARVGAMDYRMLGRSGAAVSTFALGTMTFGTETDEVGSHAQLDRFLDAGGTLIDTADVYSGGPASRSSGRGSPAAPG